jgi:hypothetical protein
MAVNRDKPDRWKNDIAASVDFYNRWFLDFAPKTFREARSGAIEQVRQALDLTEQMRGLSAAQLYQHPRVLGVLRMCTAPPLARDRLIGLANVHSHLVGRMEKQGVIPRSDAQADVLQELAAIAAVIRHMLDEDIFVWIDENRHPSPEEANRAATIVADRLTGAVSDPVIRNAQEARQLAALTEFLAGRGYIELASTQRSDWQAMPPATYATRMNVTVTGASGRSVNIPIDLIIQPGKETGASPLLIEAKAAGDFTNTNKRRKEEAQKMNQLRATYGDEVRFILFLCGYFDSGYLGYEAAEGIDWVWEHRLEELAAFGI